MNAKTFLATTGAGVARAAQNASGTWEVEHLLPGQTVPCLAADPLRPSRVYAGTHGGVLRSDDGGRNWRPAGLTGETVKAIAASPTEPGVVYAGARPARMYVSRDGGDSWAELTAFQRVRAFWWFSPAEPPFAAYVQGIALSPTDPNVIVVGIEAGAVVRSADGGQTWQGHRPGALRDCHSIGFHATRGEWVYEGGGSGAGAACSRNGGDKWRQSRAGLDRNYGWAVAADPAQPEVWYVALSPGPFKAHSEGRAEAHIFRASGDGRWQKVGPYLPDPLLHMPYALITDPAAAGHVYAGLSNGEVWHSADHGDQWQQLPFNLGGIHRAMVMLA